MFSKRTYLEINEGNTVKVKGRISTVIWQHMTALIDSHPHMNYFDLADSYQIIVYTKDQISCEGQIEITGKVTKLESEYNNPEVKISDKFAEYHIIADSWKCIEE